MDSALVSLVIVGVLVTLGLIFLKPILLPVGEVMVEYNPVDTVTSAEMDEHFDRSAGRWCEHCGIHGSHHTDRHQLFVDFVISRRS